MPARQHGQLGKDQLVLGLLMARSWPWLGGSRNGGRPLCLFGATSVSRSKRIKMIIKIADNLWLLSARR